MKSACVTGQLSLADVDYDQSDNKGWYNVVYKSSIQRVKEKGLFWFKDEGTRSFGQIMHITITCSNMC